MPAVQRELVGQGLSFDRFFVTTSVCCPARLSFLTRQYAHNHGVWSNASPNGGWLAAERNGVGTATFATELDQRGYETALIGKYLNEYPSPVQESGNPVPPGWDHWLANSGGFSKPLVDGQGQLFRFAEADIHITDLVRDEGSRFIRENRDSPFLLFLSFYAPHSRAGDPPTPASRHEGAFANVPRPPSPAFDEDDVSDKPRLIRALPRVSVHDRDRSTLMYQKRMESLLGVDEAVDSIVSVLEQEGLWDRTFVIFTSDNGFHYGEHRLPQGKNTLYDIDTRVPFVVRGPGVSAGLSAPGVAGNVDFAPTVLDIAGIPSTLPFDGISLATTILEGRDLPRRQLLLEV